MIATPQVVCYYYITERQKLSSFFFFQCDSHRCCDTNHSSSDDGTLRYQLRDSTMVLRHKVLGGFKMPPDDVSDYPVAQFGVANTTLTRLDNGGVFWWRRENCVSSANQLCATVGRLFEQSISSTRKTDATRNTDTIIGSLSLMTVSGGFSLVTAGTINSLRTNSLTSPTSTSTSTATMTISTPMPTRSSKSASSTTSITTPLLVTDQTTTTITTITSSLLSSIT